VGFTLVEILKKQRHPHESSPRKSESMQACSRAGSISHRTSLACLSFDPGFCIPLTIPAPSHDSWSWPPKDAHAQLIGLTLTGFKPSGTLPLRAPGRFMTVWSGFVFCYQDAAKPAGQSALQKSCIPVRAVIGRLTARPFTSSGSVPMNCDAVGTSHRISIWKTHISIQQEKRDEGGGSSSS
jgi:hypothetical protein